MSKSITKGSLNIVHFGWTGACRNLFERQV